MLRANTEGRAAGRRRRRWPIVVVAILAIILILYTIAWFWAAERARAVAASMLETPRGGVTIDGGDVEVAGYPLAFSVGAAPFRVAASGAAWTGQGVEARVAPWRLPAVDLHLAAPQSLDLPGAQPLRAVMTADGSGEILFDFDGNVRSARLDLPQLTLEGAALPAALTIDRATLVGEVPGREADALSTAIVDLVAVALPGAVVEGLPDAVESAAAQVSVIGAPLRSLRAPDLAAWRAAGGRLRIDAVRIQWGPLAIEAVGELALDAELQPEGTITVGIRGWRGALESVQEAGLIDRQTAEQMGAALQLFSTGSADAADPAASVALSVQNRRVSAMFFTLASFAPIAWPE